MTIAFAIPDHISRGSKDWRATPKSSGRSALATLLIAALPIRLYLQQRK